MTDAVAAVGDGTVLAIAASTIPTQDAVALVQRGAVGAHVGILYLANDDGTRRHLHLAFHFRLEDGSTPDGGYWIASRLDDLALSDVSASALLVAQCHKNGRIPYAFNPRDAQFHSAGPLQLGKSLGLTCATFVDLVFRHAGITLLDNATWEHGRSPEREREDEEGRTRLIGYLEKHAKQHAELVAADDRCALIRPEEIAAASGMLGHPITFARALPEGRRILELIDVPKVPARQ